MSRTDYFLRLCLSVCGAWLIACGASAQTDPVAEQRARFTDAEAELRSGAGPRYRALREQLDDYPLTIYLDYAQLREGLRRATPAQANDWLRRAEGSPLENRLREAWIRDHGQRQRWRALLAVQTTAPNDDELQCYWWRAKLATGDRADALQAAARLWNVGQSQHRACDPLFAEWMTESPLTDALIWSRALKAFDARSPQLMQYLTRFASPELLPLLQELYAVYRYPDRLVKDSHAADPRHAQLMTVGVRRLARVNPAQGYEALQQARQTQPFTDQQLDAMAAMIARHSLFAKSAAPEDWLVETLSRLGDDELTEIYLRNHVSEGAWSAVLEAWGWLSPERQKADVWRWWRGRALMATDNKVQAEAVWRDLATERSFHGFMAADRMGLPYQLNGSAPLELRIEIDDPGLARVRELWALDRVDQARAEWNLLLSRMDQKQQLWLAEQALAAGQPSFAIMATNTAKAWDMLDQRFPWLYRDIFEQSAATHQLTPGELVAIARRESALYPRAVSPVGAVGLMQLMPATARQVARRTGVAYRRGRLFQPEYNVDLGAHYYAQLRARFDGLRPLALAAYNAGPHRVDRWLTGAHTIDQWIDSLPFRETREYVRAVLAYALIYRLRDGESASLFSEDELKHIY
jgi:soluble lytic murein transglycosylase